MPVVIIERTTANMDKEKDITEDAPLESQIDNGHSKYTEGNSGHLSKTTSQSMSSLPPDDQQVESRAHLKERLRIERPYNSLTVSFHIL